MTDNALYDVIVVGAGIIGSYTAYHTQAYGKKTLLLDQFPLPHSRGSSHGQSRAIRSAYGAQDFYTSMMKEAFQLWQKLQDESKMNIFRRTGLLCIGQKGINYLTETADSLHRHDIPFKRLDDKEFRSMFPSLSYPEGIGGAVLDKSAGLLLAGRALSAVQNQYRNLGGHIRDGEEMLKLIPGSVPVLHTTKGTYQGRSVILCVGPWATKVLPALGVSIPLQVQKMKVCYWREKHSGSFSSHRFPVFSQKNGIGNHFVYGVPCEEYPDLVKVCLHYGPTVDPDRRDTVDDEWVVEELKKYIRAHIPGLEPNPLIVETCLYTNTPDEDFVLDFHPFWKNIVIGAGFSGHGFKLAPVVGKVLAEMAIERTPSYDMKYFRLNRFSKSHL